MSPRFYVVTPEYGEVVPVTDDGQGPLEYGCDLIEIEALTAADALVLGVKAMKEDSAQYHWFQDCESPFAGVKVQPVSDDELIDRTHAKYGYRMRS